MIILNQLTSAVIQVAILTLIPLVFYVATRRKIGGFWNWIGIKYADKVPIKSSIAILVGFLVASTIPYLLLYKSGAITYSGFTYDAYKTYGWSLQTIATILLWAVIQTSLSEEIFFRGFIGNILSRKFGWIVGTSIQAIIFGLIHIASVWGHGMMSAIVVFIMTGGIGFLLGWLSIKRANGSIVYGWMIHAAVNIISPIVAFLLLIDK